jgi:hypothetical protein
MSISRIRLVKNLPPTPDRAGEEYGLKEEEKQYENDARKARDHILRHRGVACSTQDTVQDVIEEEDEKDEKRRDEEEQRSELAGVIAIGESAADVVTQADSAEYRADYTGPRVQGITKILSDEAARDQLDDHDAHAGDEHDDEGEHSSHVRHTPISPDLLY